MRNIGTTASAVLALFAASVPVQAQAQANRTLAFFNACPHPVRFFLYHPHGDGSWQTHGWYSAAPNQRAVDVRGNDRMPHVHLENTRLYVYAESTDGSRKVWQGTTPAIFGGARYGVMQLALSVVDGKYQAGLRC